MDVLSEINFITTCLVVNSLLRPTTDYFLGYSDSNILRTN